jgi:hypothetical protein
VSELTSGAASDTDKAKKLYAAIEKIENIDFRSDGEPGLGSEWIPTGSVEQVFLDRKGASNQIAYLYLAMARIAGLNARPERIASRSQRIFSPQFRDPSQLDSVVISIQADGKEIVLDPGTRMAPFATLHWAHAAAGGLALNGNKVETIITPEQKVTDNAVIHVGSLNVTPQGGVSGTIKVAFIGQDAIRLRQLGIRAGADAVKSDIDRMISGEVPSGVEARVDHVVNLDDASKQLLAIVPISGNIGTPAGARIVLPRSFFDTRESNPFPTDEGRTAPVDVRYPMQEQDQITYVLPTGFTVEGKPQDSAEKWEPNAVFQLKLKADASSITSARTLARGFTLLDAKDYTNLHDFYQKVATADQQQLVLAPAAQATN